MSTKSRCSAKHNYKKLMKIYAILFAILCASHSAFSAAQYQITDLGTDLSGSRATSVNSSGVVVGYSWRVFEYGFMGDYKAHVWVPTTNGYVKSDLPTLPGGDTASETNNPFIISSGAYASSINDSNQIVGYSLRDFPGETARGRAAKWIPNTNEPSGFEAIDLGLPGATTTRYGYTNNYSVASAINSQGNVAVSKSWSAEYAHYFLATRINPDSSVDEFFPNSYESNQVGSIVQGLNSYGDAVGWQYELGATPNTRAFQVIDGNYANLENLTTNCGAVANSISTNRIIVGQSDVKAVYWGTNGSITSIHDENLGSVSSALSINNNSQIVGTVSSTAFLWDSVNGMRTLDSLCEDENWLIQAAYLINDSGYIVGFGTKWDAINECWESQTRAVLLTPVQ